MKNKVEILIASSIVDPKTGLTRKEVNMKKTHNFPLNSKVQVVDYGDGSDECLGLILYVTKHGRDCDGTPLYYLSHQTAEKYTTAAKYIHEFLVERGVLLNQPYHPDNANIFASPLEGGYSEESLKLISLPKT